ncbi:MAG: hypothetical protein F6K58_21230 [Symploca sp. SIO2E9]|nr:hypothetical protein [Symploca sp. SIO2E9]
MYSSRREITLARLALAKARLEDAAEMTAQDVDAAARMIGLKTVAKQKQKEDLPNVSSEPVIPKPNLPEPIQEKIISKPSLSKSKQSEPSTQEEMEGKIKVTLVNGWGVPVKVLSLDDVKITQEVIHSPRSIGNLELESSNIIPDFDVRKYQARLLERYGNFNVSTLDTDGAGYNRLQLWSIFIPQNVRQVHELLPQAYELPD